MSYTGYLSKSILTTKSCFLCIAAWMAQPPSTNRNWYLTTFQCIICSPPPTLVFTSPVSTTETEKTLWSQRIFKRCTQTVEQCPLLWESIIPRKLSRITWRPTCSQRIRFAQTAPVTFPPFSFLLLLLFFFFFWKRNEHAVAAWTYLRSSHFHLFIHSSSKGVLY